MLKDWESSSGKARTLQAVSTLVIGQKYGHGKDKTAQAVSHFLLGAALAYANGADPLSGGSAAVAAEKAAQYLSKGYDDGVSYNDAEGNFDPNRLPESVKAEIKSVTAALASMAGVGVSSGNGLYNAQVGGVIGLNAVENNWLSAIEVNKKVEYDRACKQGDKQACTKRDALTQLDQERDLKLLTACQNPQSQQCRTLRFEAEKAQSSLKVGPLAKYAFWTEEARDKAKQQEHNKEFAETDMTVLLSYGKTPQQIAQNKKLLSVASNFLVDLSVVGTVKDFKEADTLLDYGVATILAIPGVSQVEKLRHIADFRKAYQTAKEAGDLKAAKEILELAQKAQKSPNHLSSLAQKERLINSRADFQRIDFDGHVFSGEVKRKSVVGGHSLISGNVREIPNSATKPNAAGVYEAKIEVFDSKTGKWVAKTNNNGISTMFPKNWDAAKIKSEVEYAFANRTIKTKVRGGQQVKTWEGITPSGVKVEGYLEPNITVYPVK